MIPSEPTSIYRADTIDLIAAWHLLWRYKYLITLVAAICAGISVFLALTATPIFRAEVVVIPTREEGMREATSLASRLGGLANIAGLSLGGGGTSADALAVLESRNLVEEFIERKSLVNELYPNSQTPPTLWLAVDRFRRTILNIRTDNNRGTTMISINWTDPSVAASWANGLVALANDMIRTKALEDSGGNIEYLNKQLEQTNVVELRRGLYNLIETETQRMMLANARAEYAFTIVDPAVAPESRTSPRRTLMVLTGGALGVLLGVVVAFIHNAAAWYRVSGAMKGGDDAQQPRR